jgi:uncharacterized iron-regulated membrane protein
MTTTTSDVAPDDARPPETGDPDPPAAPARTGRSPEEAEKSRLWRTVWRTHFYAGVMVLPVLMVLAVTGLLVLYGDNILDRTDGALRLVTPAGTAHPLDEQVAAAKAAAAGRPLQGVTPPTEVDRATKVSFLDKQTGPNPWDAEVYEVYVNPYTNTVLGSKMYRDDLPGLARLAHGSLLVHAKVPMPTLAGVLGQSEDGVFTPVEVGDLLVEIAACWAVVLAATGVYLWWPRKKGARQRLLIPRVNARGRAKWRDLHAIPGAIFSLVLVFLVMTGLPWSGFWGGNWSHLTGKVLASTDNAPMGVVSTAVKAGDLDRFGNPIPWASAEVAVPASSDPAAAPGGGAHHGGGSAGAGQEAEPAPPPATPLTLAQVTKVATAEGMLPGYSITLPEDTVKDGQTLYGTYALTNTGLEIGNARTLFVDQFSGKPVVDHGSGDWGWAAWATTAGINVHEGHQFGLLNRILMTGLTLGLLWSIFTAGVMWWKRRPARSAGLPRRPADVSLQKGLIILAVVLGVIFPLAGLTMIAVVLLDRYVIRRVPRLRHTFGMR